MFQFPSNGKAYHKTTTKTAIEESSNMFQFPSNGKAYHKLNSQGTTTCRLIPVSIPFKRESVSQVKSKNLFQTKGEFQFPSNGKAYHKLNWFLSKSICALVSIPFKRESVSQVGV